MGSEEFAARLLHQRERVRGWSQPALGRYMAVESARLGRPIAPVSKATISAWENRHRFPEPWYAYVLCDTLGVSADALALGHVLTPAVVADIEASIQRQPAAPPARPPSAVTTLWAHAAPVIDCGHADWERLAFSMYATRQVDTQTVANLRWMTDRFLEARGQVSARALLPAMHAHIATLRTLLPLTSSTPLRREVAAILGDTACAAGELWYTLYDFGEAQHAYRFALDLGHELGERTIRAMALISQGLLYTNRLHGEDEGLPGGPPRSVALHDAAETAAGPGAPPELRLWLHSRRAWQHAGAGDEVAAKRDLDTAQRALAQAGPTPEPFYEPFNGSYLLVSRAKVGFLLGELHHSIELFDQAARSTSGYLRPYFEVQLATACAQAGELERAGGILMGTLDATMSRGSTMLTTRISKLLDRDLSRYTTHPIVRTVRERLANQVGAA